MPFIDSNLINECLDARFPNPPLRPACLEQLYDLRLWSRYIDTVVRRAQVKFNINQAVVPIASQWSDETLEQVLASVPTEERREQWWRAARQPYSEDELSNALNQLSDMADRIEVRLENSQLLFGGCFGLGEINTSPYVKRLSELDANAVSERVRPRLFDWWQGIVDRPAYVKARIGACDP